MSKEIFKDSKVCEAQALGDIEARMDQLRDQVGDIEHYGTEDEFKRLNEEYEFLERRLEEKNMMEGLKQDRFMEIRPLVHRLVEAQIYSNYGSNPARVFEEIVNQKLLSKSELQNLIKEIQNIKNYDHEIELIAKTRDKGKQNDLDIQIAEMVFGIREKIFMIDAKAVVRDVYERPQEVETLQLKNTPRLK